MSGRTTTKGKASSAKQTSRKKPSSASTSRTKAAARGRAKSTSSRKSSTSRSRQRGTGAARKAIAVLSIIVLLTAFWYLFVRPEMTRHHPTFGTQAYGISIPDGFSVHGIDISHHQGDIDWDALQGLQQAEIPLRFVFIKATEGGDHGDPMFSANYVGARSHGFICGAYHFYNPDTDPIRQADFFISQVQLGKGDLPPVIDIEVRPSRSQQDVFYAQLSSFLYRLEAHYGVQPIIYTSYKYKERYLGRQEFDRYPLWIAHYNVESLKYQGEWSFWQHSDRGTIPGIHEKTDLNVFNGSFSELLKLTLH